MSIVVVTPSLDLPVNITTALRHMRVLIDESDLVALYLQAAASLVEDYTGRALLTKTYCLHLTNWPCFKSEIRAIELRRTPLIAINSVKYIDGITKVLTTVDASHYRADISSEPGHLVFAEDNFDLPSVDVRESAVQIEFTAGYGTKESQVAPMLRLAVLELAHNFYDNRMPLSNIKQSAIPYSLQHILRAMRIESLVSID